MGRARVKRVPPSLEDEIHKRWFELERAARKRKSGKKKTDKRKKGK